MKDYITKTTEAIMDSLEKHGLIPTVMTLIILITFITVMILAWQLPEIILAIKA